MLRFLLTTMPSDDLGLLARSLPVASELAALGHEVVFSSPARAPRRLIADAGFRNLVRPGVRLRFGTLIAPALDALRGPRPVDIWNADHAAALLGMRHEWFVRASCASIVDSIRDTRPDAVVDFWNPSAAIAARATGCPLVTVIQADAHPASDGFIWWKHPPASLPTAVPAVNRVLRGYDLRPIDKVAELSVGDLTLVVGSPETDPLPASAAVTYVGALVWEKADAALPAWIARQEAPLVWLYGGKPKYGFARGTLDSEIVLRACREALAGERLSVVLTTGFQRIPRRLRPLPANFRTEEYLPGPQMAAASDLLIHHGGYGSCQTALLAGKPSVIVPTFSERESNARRMAAIGAAAIVPVETSSGAKRVDAERLRQAVRTALTDRTMRANAAEAGSRLRTYGGARFAAQAIARFALEAR